MLTHGQRNNVTTIAKFDGLRKCCVFPPPKGARKTTFDAIATMEAKANGNNSVLGKSSIPRAIPEIRAGAKNVSNPNGSLFSRTGRPVIFA